MAVLATGKDALIGLVGPEMVRQAQAFHKFDGDKREKPRSSWDLYCYNKDGAWIVGCLDERTNRKAQFQYSYAIDRASSYKERLDKGEKPWQPSKILDSPMAWKDGGSRLAIDFEGWNRIERISLANEVNILSVQWSPQVAYWLKGILEQYDRILAHNFGFEINMLEAEGFELDLERWHCTMAAHRALFPWRDDGLGKCAPLYVMTVPFKHEFAGNIELYSAWDAGILLEIDDEQQRLMGQLGGRRAYELERTVSLRCRRLRGRVDATVGGVRSPLTRAAGTLEWRPITNGRLPGWDSLLEPEVAGRDVFSITEWTALERLLGEYPKSAIQCATEIARRHVLGYGVRTIRNGVTGRLAKQLPRLGDDLRDSKEFVTTHRTELWDSQNPVFCQWRDLVRKLAERDGYVSTFTGRRLYGFKGGEAQRGLIWATMADLQREELERHPRWLPGEVFGEIII